MYIAIRYAKNKTENPKKFHERDIDQCGIIQIWTAGAVESEVEQEKLRSWGIPRSATAQLWIISWKEHKANNSADPMNLSPFAWYCRGGTINFLSFGIQRGE
jgi:hypothetical protein